MDADIISIPRSREENQERAFIAASRRKDRSLDARLESANSASMLHKKRTGKGFHITKEIVEREAMYEEVDERYAEKRIRMLQAQNLQIEQQFHCHLIAAFGNRPPPGSSIANRRASTDTPRPSADGGPRKTSLDLTNIRSSFSQDSSSMESPLATGDGYILSPTNILRQQRQLLHGLHARLRGAILNGHPLNRPQLSPDPRVREPASHHPSMEHKNTELGHATANPHPGPNPHRRSVNVAAKDRLTSAPELPLHQAPQIAPSGSISGPTPTPSGHGPTLGHSRGQSQPSNNFCNLHLLTQSTHLDMPASSASSPRIEALSAETHSTPDFCPTPHSPMSPTAVATQMGMPAPVKTDGGNGNGNGDVNMVSNEGMDADYSDFSQFALHLGNSSVPFSDREQFGFHDFIAVDEFTSISC
ncbi:hypothetical protein N7494_005333 [Penicillium frequentans]|uniref:Uncharacterized protein n=1 Tax=Penicillium frequentans TaxID=3151616 RepID=A0AAD6GGX7_9EURO|nr:hypothetical protein N7494_005333 [Penicillium glabrum]